MYLVMDFDGTVTDAYGQLRSTTLQALALADHHQVGLGIVTGRPGATALHLLTTLPLQFVIAEGGAIVYFKQNDIVQRRVHPQARLDTKHLLEREISLCLSDSSFSWALDNPFREMDVAIDIGENVSPWTKERIQDCVQKLRALPLPDLMVTVSNIHINCWIGRYSKASMLRLYAEDCQGLDWKTFLKSAVYVGDSPNDASLFDVFKERSYGVRNIDTYLSQLSHRPHHLLDEGYGDGVSELVDRLLAKPRVYFSVIIPVFNHPKVLDVCFRGLERAIHAFTQHLSETVEVLVVDNNSTDPGVDEVMAHWLRTASFKVIHIKREALVSTFALCSARNIGLRLAQGVMAVSLDSDCIVNENYFIQAFQCSLEHVYVAERIFIHVDNLPDTLDETALKGVPLCKSPSNYGKTSDRRWPGLRSPMDVEFPVAMVHGGNVFFNRKQALGIGGFDEAYDGQWGYEDQDFVYRLLKSFKNKLLYAPGCHVYHVDDFDRSVSQKVLDENPRKLAMSNPNFLRVCDRIPGYKSFKEKMIQQYTA